MAHLQIKNIPPHLHQALRERAELENMTMSDYVIDILQRDLDLPSPRQWLASLRDRQLVTTDEVVPALDAARDERDEDLLAGLDSR